jgi:hypothetical protein
MPARRYWAAASDVLLAFSAGSRESLAWHMKRVLSYWDVTLAGVPFEDNRISRGSSHVALSSLVRRREGCRRHFVQPYLVPRYRDQSGGLC